MKSEVAFFASTLAAAMLLSVPAMAQQSTPAQQTDWTKRVTMSAQGGHILGNPLAKHTIAEYMSYTCNHCANFEKESHGPLTNDFIKKGHISFEVRNFILNPIDLTAAMLARCGGRTKFFGNHRALLNSQASWLAKFQATPADVMKTMNDGTVPERLKKIAKATDFYGLMQKRGYAKAKVDACLSDQATQKTILGMTEYASKTLKINATPSFTLNGKTIKEAHAWANLRAVLMGLPN